MTPGHTETALQYGEMLLPSLTTGTRDHEMCGAVFHFSKTVKIKIQQFD